MTYIHYLHLGNVGVHTVCYIIEMNSFIHFVYLDKYFHFGFWNTWSHSLPDPAVSVLPMRLILKDFNILPGNHRTSSNIPFFYLFCFWQCLCI